MSSLSCKTMLLAGQQSDDLSDKEEADGQADDEPTPGDAFAPRSYQVELLEVAKQRNVIIPLGTGMGKTFIAVMLIKEFAADIRVPFERGGKRAFFLVDKVALIEQQAEQIRRNSNLTVGTFHGRMNRSYTDSIFWDEELKKNHVFVVTAQIFLNLLTQGFMSLNRINLIIFDECHHVNKSHPYRLIMDLYNECTSGGLPRILGLTASVVSSKVKLKDVTPFIHRLETLMHSSVVTTKDSYASLKYAAQPHIELVKCRCFAPSFDGVERVTRLCDSAHRFFSECRSFPVVATKMAKILGRLKRTLQTLGGWCTMIACKRFEAKLARQAQHASQTSASADGMHMCAVTCLRTIQTLLQQQFGNAQNWDSFCQGLPHRVHRLFHILRFLWHRCPSSSGDVPYAFSGIVFVRERLTAHLVLELIRKAHALNREGFQFLKAEALTGSATRLNTFTASEEMALKWRQDQILRLFRSNDLNLLVSTNVLEEGIDVRQCNFVIRFDPPQDFRSYIQSKGRARAADSMYFVLVDEDESAIYQQNFHVYEKIEEVLRSYTPAEEAENVDAVDSSLRSNELDLLCPPYCVKVPGGYENAPVTARVSLHTAIALINRYCSMVDEEAGAPTPPRCVVERTGMMFTAKIRLPLNCPITDVIQGPPMFSKKQARMAAALEACKRLHACGELDEHLLPVSRKTLFGGTRSQRQGDSGQRELYPRKTADVICSGKPEVGSSCFVYVVQVEPTSRKRTNLSCIFETNRRFGIISKSAFPPVPSFPIYSSDFDALISVKGSGQTVVFTDETLSLMKSFHHCIFRNLLDMHSSIMVYDPDSAPGIYYVVPLVKKGSDQFTIDVKLIHQTCTYVKAKRPSRDELDVQKRTYEFREERFADAVIVPYHLDGEISFAYGVTGVRKDMTPLSTAPHQGLRSSFEEYFRTKHGIKIYHLDHPMVAADRICGSLNVLVPSNAVSNAKKVTTLMHEMSASAPHAALHVPELVSVHPIPHSFWRFAYCLPSIMYRFDSLLLADELRRKIAREAYDEYDEESLSDFVWPPLRLELSACSNVVQERSLDDIEERFDAPMKFGVLEAFSEAGVVERLGELCYDDDVSSETSSTNHQELDSDFVTPPVLSNDDDDDYEQEFSDAVIIESKSLHSLHSIDHCLQNLDQNLVSKAMVANVLQFENSCLNTSGRDSNSDLGRLGSTRQFDRSMTESSGKTSPPKIDADEDVALSFSISDEDSFCFEDRSTSTVFVPSATAIHSDGKQLALGKSPAGFSGSRPTPAEVLNAITLLSSIDGINLERLETLGDSFLKYSMTVFAFKKFPNFSEGKLSTIRSKEVCNNNLYELGKKKQLGGMLIQKPFRPGENWWPHGYVPSERAGALPDSRPKESSIAHDQGMKNSSQKELENSVQLISEKLDFSSVVESDPSSKALLSERGMTLAMQHHDISNNLLSGKCIADAVEALTGVYLLCRGCKSAVRLLQWFGLNIDLQELKKPVLIRELSPGATDNVRHLWNQIGLSDFEEIIGYTFCNKYYLVEALTHSSMTVNCCTRCYEKLEFLGDAVMDFLVTQYLYGAKCHYSPGVITDLRSALVNNNIFATLAVKNHYHKFLMHQCPVLFSEIQKFVDLLDELQQDVNFDTMYLLHENDCDVAEEIEVPKVLGDIFESVAGAIYLDSCCSLETVWKIYFKMMKDSIQRYMAEVPVHPLRRLYELYPNDAAFTEMVRLSSGDKFRATLKVKGLGTFAGIGKTAQLAKTSAAKKALKCWQMTELSDMALRT